MIDVSPSDSDQLRALTQRLFRRFGVLAGDQTPCGQPLPLAHAHALQVLLAAPEPLTQQALGSSLGIDKSNVARLCARLVELGHATQAPGRRDRRSRVVTLTAKGKRVAGVVDDASRARFAAVLAAVPDAARAGVLEALGHLLVAIDTVGAAPLAQETETDPPTPSPSADAVAPWSRS
jgi:DNA-binding MarR family transcriptional regulator